MKAKIAHANRLENCTKSAKAMAQKIADSLPDGSVLVIGHGCDKKIFYAREQRGGIAKSVDPQSVAELEIAYDGVNRFEVKK